MRDSFSLILPFLKKVKNFYSNQPEKFKVNLLGNTIKLSSVTCFSLLLYGCNFYESHVSDSNNLSIIKELKNGDNFPRLLSQRRCAEAWTVIWPSVAIAQPSAMALLGKYMDDGVILAPMRAQSAQQNRRVSLLLQLESYGYGFSENDARVKKRLLSSEVAQPQGGHVAACLRKANNSEKSVQGCIEESIKFRIIDEFIKFYTDTEDAVGSSHQAQCGRRG